jgi:hypothetical protein
LLHTQRNLNQPNKIGVLHIGQAHPRINLLKINATTKATTYLPQREGEGEEGEGGEGGAETVKGEWEGRREVGGEVGGDGSAGKGEDKVVGGRGG